MDKGIIGGLMGETGTVITKDGGYNFNIRVVDGIIKNGQEVEFEVEGNAIKTIYGEGSKKPTNTPQPIIVPKPAPVAAPKPAPVAASKPKSLADTFKKKEDTAKTDNREFLTEEK